MMIGIGDTGAASLGPAVVGATDSVSTGSVSSLEISRGPALGCTKEYIAAVRARLTPANAPDGWWDQYVNSGAVSEEWRACFKKLDSEGFSGIDTKTLLIAGGVGIALLLLVRG